jgi:hypothetical protein
MALSPRVVALLALLALLPAVAYAATQPDQLSGVIAAINVLLITASLLLALRPVQRAAAATR